MVVLVHALADSILLDENAVDTLFLVCWCCLFGVKVLLLNPLLLPLLKLLYFVGCCTLQNVLYACSDFPQNNHFKGFK